MKRICSLLAALALVVGLCACGKSAQERWQAQYDLGMKYLSELNYEQAVAAFTEAIFIDAKRPEAYIGRGDARVGIGTAESLAAAQGDYEAALALDNTLENAWLGLINTYILRGDYEGAQRALEQALAVLGAERLQEQQEELARLSAPEPGSEEYLQAAAAHLAPAVGFDFAINGVPLATADIYTLASLLGGHVKSTSGSATLSTTGTFPAYAINSQSHPDRVDALQLYQDMGPGYPVRVWPSEYFAGIAVTDTLDQALEKLGFTAEERAWLATCGEIELTRRTDGTWWLMASQPRSYAPDQCTLTLLTKEDGKCTYSFTYSMETAGFDRDTPVDGRAALNMLYIHNTATR